MKVLYICNEVSSRNGWAVINYHTVKEAVDKGHDVTCLVEKGSLSVEIPGVRYLDILPGPISIGKNPLSFLKSVSLVKGVIDKGSFDIVHVLVEPYVAYFAFLEVNNLYMTLVGTYSLQILNGKLKSAIYRKALGRVTHFFTISDYTKDEFLKVHPTSKKVELSPLGVDHETFSIENKAQQKEKCSFCLIGQVKPRKGVLIAIKAIEVLKEKYPQVKLYIAGDASSEYSHKCLSYVSHHKLEDNVEFLGHREQSSLKDLYSKCLANVLPSVNADDGAFEGFGLIHLEANACSIPSIGSLNCGNESAIRSGVNGFLVPQRDHLSLAETMGQIIEMKNNSTYGDLAQSSFNYAATQTWQNYFQTLEFGYGGGL